MRLLGQFQPVYFFYEKVLSVKKRQNVKQTTLIILEVFARLKNVAFVV